LLADQLLAASVVVLTKVAQVRAEHLPAMLNRLQALRSDAKFVADNPSLGCAAASEGAAVQPIHLT
jgi:hypothetical protein